MKKWSIIKTRSCRRENREEEDKSFSSFFSIIIFFFALEAVLQAAHIVANTMTRSEMTDSSGPVILCLGDSHTYGLYVPEDKTYPAQLQISGGTNSSFFYV